MPVKVSSTTTEATSSTRVIDTGGGFLIEETIPGKQSSMPTKIIYDPGCTLAVCVLVCKSILCRVLELACYFLDILHSFIRLSH